MLDALPTSKAAVPYQPEYGIELDIGSFFKNDPQLEEAYYEVWTQGTSPELLGSGTVDAIGRSNLAMSNSSIPVEIIVGENEWFDVEDIQILDGDEE